MENKIFSLVWKKKMNEKVSEKMSLVTFELKTDMFQTKTISYKKDETCLEYFREQLAAEQLVDFDKTLNSLLDISKLKMTVTDELVFTNLMEKLVYTIDELEIDGDKESTDSLIDNKFDYAPMYSQPSWLSGGMVTGNYTQAFDGPKKKENKKSEESNKPKLTFKEVVGMDEVKEKLHDVINQFKEPEKYAAWGVTPIGGILLHGPSGTGKSYISEALANEIDAKFVKVSAGDIMSKYLGESGKNIKRIFDDARQSDFAVIYIDEIDFVASTRGTDDNSKERNATLNELLVQMASPDNNNLFMIFATNMLDLLDPAFLRSGRCDFKLEIPLPDFECRKGILESCSTKRPLSEDVDFTIIARNMSGMNCADCTHVANEAARRALKLGKDCVEKEDFDVTFEEMICGASSKTKKLNEHDKDVVAIHETGHLLANEYFKVNKTKKISILPRGTSLGYVLHANEDNDDRFLHSEQELLNKIKVNLAGRAAEYIIFREVCTGASNDLQKATEIATAMICNYGFCDEFGLTVVNSKEIMMQEKLHELVKNMLDEQYSLVINFLANNMDTLKGIAEVLKDKEEMNSEEISELMKEKILY